MGGSPCSDRKCRQDNLDLLEHITSNLSRRNVLYWLDFGGLLGVVREGDMIDGDDDLDICATLTDHEKVVSYFNQINDDPYSEYYVTKNKKHRVCGDFLQGDALLLYQIRPKSAHNKALLDLFFFKHDDADDAGRLKSMWTWEDDTFVDTVFPLQQIYVDAWGFSINVPNKWNTRLIEKYGNEYMTPKSHKNTMFQRWYRGKNVFQRCAANMWGRQVFLIGFITLLFLLSILFYFSKP